MTYLFLTLEWTVRKWVGKISVMEQFSPRCLPRSLFTDTGFHGVVFSYSDDGDGDFENDQRDVTVDNNVFDGCAMSRDW